MPSSKTGNKSNYAVGRKVEQSIAQQMRSSGCSVKVSKGSRGPADMVAIDKSSGVKYSVQVKSSLQQNNVHVPSKDISRLEQFSKKNNSIPLVVQVNKNREITASIPMNGSSLTLVDKYKSKMRC